MTEILDLKNMFRSLSRNPLFSVINVLGFSLSLTLVILLGMYAHHELTIDSFQQNKERIYVYSTIEGAYSPPIMAPYIQDCYPDVESYTRLFAREMILGYQQEMYRTSVMTVDSTFFDIFSYPLLQGDRRQVMKGDRNEIVVSESYAHKVFGRENPIGKQLTYKYKGRDDNGQIVMKTSFFTIGAVMKDLENTLFNSYDLLMNINGAAKVMGPWLNEGWGSGNHLSVFLMKGSKNPNDYHDDLLVRFKEVYWLFKDSQPQNFKFTSLSNAYFEKEVNTHHTTRGGGSMKQIVILSGVALLILIFAIINYINLTLAQSSNRARELATRRLLGSPRSHLFWKLILESVLLCALSFVIALFLAKLFTPTFMNLMELPDPLFSNIPFSLQVAAIVGILFVGVLSGVFPALVITNFTPLDVVRGTFVRKTRQVYSKLLIGFQYTITLMLLICAYVIFAQTDFLRKVDKGFDNRNLIYVQNETGIPVATLCAEMRKIPLGMLAMASFFIRQRENEIAIRKAYGSGNGELMRQLQKHFVLLIGIAFIIAAPISYWVMRNWLSEFENQVSLSPVYFILPLIGVLLMAIDIIFYLGRKAIHTNPAETLKR